MSNGGQTTHVAEDTAEAVVRQSDDRDVVHGVVAVADSLVLADLLEGRQVGGEEILDRRVEGGHAEEKRKSGGEQRRAGDE